MPRDKQHKIKNDGFLSYFLPILHTHQHVYCREGSYSNDKMMMTGIADKNVRTYGWHAVPFAIKVPVDQFTTYCLELCKNVADLCTANSRLNTKYYIIHPNPCINERNSRIGNIAVPPMDQCITDLGVADIIRERLYEGSNAIIAATV